ncbi:sensor histidine kinase [Streptosporangium carneum]|uniref:histidine kinase n=1 Tax=Streptosporangium carneum TaxID=47481 RepID=A0A9W6HUX6_9ACTN|nr:ATP-binding protein [Streptosporangium carneum]GLK06796.1 two-component sensor histidine kinase [Streptosporangium carneum]
MIFAVVLGIGSFATSLAVRTRVQEQTVHTLSQAARQAYEINRRLHSDLLPTQQVSRLQVVTRDGRVAAASPMMQGRPALSDVWPAEDDPRVVTRSCTAVPGDEQSCFIIVGLQDSASSFGDVMVYAATPEPPLLTGHSLEIGLVGFSVAILALLGWGTWRAVGRTLEPVEQIRREMSEITASDLSRRMPVSDEENEMSELTRTINATLERLERAVEHQRRFAADASHELRTPLTGLRTKLELALVDPEAEDPVATIRSVLDDADRLQAIVNDLLLLARLDAGVSTEDEPIDLAELVAGEVGRRPSRHEIRTHLTPDVMVRGDRLQLCRLLTNLLANADRHAANKVAIRVDREGNDAVVEISDDGLGIPTEERERIFQRFTRLDSARSRDAGGTGLGLPIARDIASAHRGILYATDSANGPGARLVLRLPLATVMRT